MLLISYCLRENQSVLWVRWFEDVPGDATVESNRKLEEMLLYVWQQKIFTFGKCTHKRVIVDNFLLLKDIDKLLSFYWVILDL